MLQKNIKKFSQSGFTLVELMIVVAIIGILAAIAIPNFQKYQAKSRTSEAKVSLSAVFSAEKSFQVENGTFTGCLNSAGFGYEPAPAQYLYTTGFTDNVAGLANNTCLDKTGAVMACNNMPNTPGTPLCAPGVTVSHFVATASPGGGIALATVADIAGDALSGTLFTAVAAGHVNPSAATVDIWTINESKLLNQTAIGY